MIREFYIFRGIAGALLSLLLTFNGCSSSYHQESSSDNLQYIPYLKDIVVDGDPSDWPESYPPVRLLSDIRGNAPSPSDLFAQFRLAWNEKGLLVMAEIQDNIIYEDPIKFWNGDGMEIFISPGLGSFEIVQISMRPSLDLKDSLVSVKIFDHRISDSLKDFSPELMFLASKTSSTYSFEGIIPLDIIGIPEISGNMEMAFQVYINDSDSEGDTTNFSLPWFPVRDSYRNPFAFHKIQFSKTGFPSMPYEVRAFILDNEFIQLKVLSDRPVSNRALNIRTGSISKHFGRHEVKNDMFIWEWKLPVYKLFSDNDRLSFFSNDSLFFKIEPIVLHRIFEGIPEPNRFEKEIRIFEIIDYFNPLPPNSTLITGSSTVRKWKTINRDLPGFEIVNRGFGGSTMKDLNYYAERMVFRYVPSRLIIYEGDNDIARGATPNQFIDDCSDFIRNCQTIIPETEIFFMSIKPSPSRMKNWKDMQSANLMLEELSSRYENVHYIDISPGLLNESGEPKRDLFLEDRLHLNESGYRVISRALDASLNK